MILAIRAIRKRQGLALYELAERAGIPAPNLSELERGIGNPTLATLQRVADALGVHVAELVATPTAIPEDGAQAQDQP